jgi:hypothetical protein
MQSKKIPIQMTINIFILELIIKDDKKMSSAQMIFILHTIYGGYNIIFQCIM